MKALITIIKFLVGLAALAALSIYIFVNMPITININPGSTTNSNNITNSTVITNSNVNTKVVIRTSAAPSPQPTIKTAINPEPTAPREETSAKPDIDSNEGIEEQPVVRTRRSPTYQPPTRTLNDIYQDNSGDNYREAYNDSEQNSCSCPVRKPRRASVRIQTSDDDIVVQESRPTSYRYSRSEQRQETVINGVRTGRRTVTITNNGETRTYVQDY
ncbi:MAG TPA: hypothetical protein VF604_13580 [Pyrinomonadaceae bacterium]|jgi:hypothetical protein